VYFDINGNRDLTDDPAMDAEDIDIDGDGRNAWASFPVTDVTWQFGKNKVPYTFRIAAYWRGEKLVKDIAKEDVASDDFRVYFGTSSWFRGEFDLDGTRYRFIVSDANVNGVFGDVASIRTDRESEEDAQPDGDRFFLTSEEKIGYGDAYAFGDVLIIGAKPYQLAVDCSGLKLVLKPARLDLVPVTLGMDVDRLSVCPVGDGHGVMLLKPSGKEVKLPPGTYRVASYRAFRKDKEGDLWSAIAVGTGETPDFTVRAGERNAARFGEPYEARATIPEDAYQAYAANGGTSVSIHFSLRGRAQEEIVDLRHESGDNTTIPLAEGSRRRAKEPSYKIVKATGEIVDQGTFKYG
jgi:hypothetical protein